MKTVTLTRGYQAVIDDEDAEIAAHKWFALVTKSGLVYAVRNSPMVEGKRTIILMHRVITGAVGREVKVDHINGDTLDNRRANLRLVSHAENLRNTGLRKNNVTGVSGVQRCARTNLFQVFFQLNGKNTYFGRYRDLSEATRVRRSLELQHWGAIPYRSATHA